MKNERSASEDLTNSSAYLMEECRGSKKAQSVPKQHFDFKPPNLPVSKFEPASNLYKRYFALTITFKPEFHKYNSKYLNDWLTKFLNTYCKKRGISLDLWGEFSEVGKFHYHGYLSTDTFTARRLFIRWVGIKVGFVKVKPIDNDPVWAEYCNKQQRDLYEHMGVQRIIHISTSREKYQL